MKNKIVAGLISIGIVVLFLGLLSSFIAYTLIFTRFFLVIFLIAVVIGLYITILDALNNHER